VSSRRRWFSQVEESPNEARNNTALGTAADIPASYLGEMRASIHRLHGLHRFHRLHGFHWFHRLHPSDALIRFFKRQFFRMLQLRLASHRFDLVTMDPDKLNTIFALNTENEVLAGPKQLRGLRPFAGSKTRALILLLSRVATAQRDLCVITVILNQ
jgi:hypothetical protein